MIPDLISDSPFDYQVSTKELKGESVFLISHLGCCYKHPIIAHSTVWQRNQISLIKSDSKQR